tara:strand:- start:705 stop:2381 length:1677 start_codon:yes stop_codon:yes gene_type:complete
MLDALKENNLQIPLPNSIKYYQSDSNLLTLIGEPKPFLKEVTSEFLTKAYQPFYFKTHEVTNGEYQEFVHAVFDSIARVALGEEDAGKWTLDYGEAGTKLNYKPSLSKALENDSNKWLLRESGLYVEGEYYGIKLNAKKLIYEYWVEDEQYVRRKEINIYPDTLAWIHDFKNSSIEVMTQMYYWHPVYKDYPVVGVSYNQTLAYLHWKEGKLKKELKRDDISISLPTPIQWEYMMRKESSLVTKKGTWTKTNLKITEETSDNTMLLNLRFTDRDIGFDKFLGENVFSRLNWNNRNEFTSNSYPNRKTTPDYDFQTINDKVNHIGGNISEWMNLSFSDYKPYRNAQLRSLNLLESEDSKMLITILNREKFDEKGKLVMGANWYDKRLGLINGVPAFGGYAKSFVHPDSSHSTIGFRYVIYYKEGIKISKNEKRIEPKYISEVLDSLNYFVLDSCWFGKSDNLNYLMYTKNREVSAKEEKMSVLSSYLPSRPSLKGNKLMTREWKGLIEDHSDLRKFFLVHCKFENQVLFKFKDEFNVIGSYHLFQIDKDVLIFKRMKKL